MVKMATAVNKIYSTNVYLRYKWYVNTSVRLNEFDENLCPYVSEQICNMTDAQTSVKYINYLQKLLRATETVLNMRSRLAEEPSLYRPPLSSSTATDATVMWSKYVSMYVCVCVAFVTLVHPAIAIGPNEMPFGRDTHVVPSNIVFDGPGTPSPWE